MLPTEILREALPALDAGAVCRIRGRTTLPLELTVRQTTTVRGAANGIFIAITTGITTSHGTIGGTRGLVHLDFSTDTVPAIPTIHRTPIRRLAR